MSLVEECRFHTYITPENFTFEKELGFYPGQAST